MAIIMRDVYLEGKAADTQRHRTELISSDSLSTKLSITTECHYSINLEIIIISEENERVVARRRFVDTHLISAPLSD